MNAQDRMDIIDVQHLYGHVLDRSLWSRLGEVFAPDGVFDPSDVGLPPLRGMDEIREKLIPLEEASPDRCHHATNIVIVPTGDGAASVESKYLVNHATGVISYGEYSDRMVRTGEGWRITERKTRRRALGVGAPGAQKYTIDWDELLAAAPPRPPLAPAVTVNLSLADRIALLDLQHLYGHVLDRGLWDRIGHIFSEDGVFDPSSVGLPAMHGLEEIREKLIPLEEAAGPRRCHHSTNAVILEGSGDRARMLSKYICASESLAVAYGEYEDDLVRAADGWRIACRKTFRRATGLPAPEGAAAFTIDWDSLLAAAPSRPPMVAAPALLPLGLEDRLAIEQTLARYGHLFDNYLVDELGEVFTADAVFDPTSVGLTSVKGIAALRDTFFHVSADHPRDSQRAHHTTNVSVLAATTHSATVLSKYIVRHERAAIAYGEYEDTLVRTADGWRIAYRKTFRRALGIDDGQSDHFEVDANGRRIRAPAQA